MPEGDTIFRLAARLRGAVVGRVVTKAESRATGTFAPIVGDTVVSIETHGKNLFFVFKSGLAIHSHLGMHGSWRLFLHAEHPRLPSTFRALLVLGDRSLVCFRAPVARLLSRSEVARMKAETEVGLDPLREPFDEVQTASIVAKFSTRAAPVGVVLLDQRVIAGVGNVLKSETLFVARQDPFVSCASCTEENLRHLVDTAVRILRESVAKKGTAPIDDDAAPFRSNRRITRPYDSILGTRGGALHWVYLRAGEPCFSCGTEIAMRYQGEAARSTYYCPECQSVALSRAPSIERAATQARPSTRRRTNRH